MGSNNTNAQRMSKSYKTVKVGINIDAPAEKVWQTMVLDYGAISNFSPYIYASGYENGSLKGEEGAERKCDLSADGKRWSHERIQNIDYKNMVMQNIIVAAAKMPLDINNSQAFYRVKDNGNGTSIASYEFQFRTKPSFMGGLIKGSFQKTLEGTLIGLKYYVETGEKVTPANGKYEEIQKEYATFVAS